MCMEEMKELEKMYKKELISQCNRIDQLHEMMMYYMPEYVAEHQKKNEWMQKLNDLQEKIREMEKDDE